MKIKKVLAVALTVACVGCVAGCSDGKQQETSTDSSLQTLKDAVSGLSSIDGDYVVSNTMELPSGNTCYIDIVTPNGSYKEYPVDSNGNTGTVEYSKASNTQYVLYDWITNDNKMYMLNNKYNSSDADNSNLWVSMPNGFGELSKSRNTLFIDKMYDGLSDFKESSTVAMDLGNGSVDVTMYTAKLSSDKVKEICGADTLGLYNIIKNAKSSSDNVKSLMNYYTDELDMSLTFSDANVTFGIYDGAVRYMQIEAGGLGSRMYYTKTVLTQNITERTQPDFSSSKDYMTSVSSLADYVAKYPSYNDAMNALNASNSDSSNK